MIAHVHGTVAGVGLDIAEVQGSRVNDVQTIEPGPVHLGQGLSQLSWSPDSRSLSFALLDGSTADTTFWTLETGLGVTSLAAARQIPLDRPGLTWNGYLGRIKGGRAMGVGVLTSASGNQEVVTLSPVTGHIHTTLFTAPGSLCVPSTQSTGPQCAYPFSNPVTGDVSGSNVLVAGVIPRRDGTPMTSGSANLYRWDVGTHSPVRLTPQVIRATWGPASRG